MSYIFLNDHKFCYKLFQGYPLISGHPVTTYCHYKLIELDISILGAKFWERKKSC